MDDNTRHNKTNTSSVDHQLTVMLLLVTFALLILTGPQYIRYLVYIIVDNSRDASTFAGYMFFVHLSNKLSFCNSSVNVLLYCLGGSKFRSEAKTLLTCGRHGNRGGLNYEDNLTLNTSLASIAYNKSLKKAGDDSPC